jgi:hypothetical protein
MQLTINYREDATSFEHKDFFLICDVSFSNEERAVAGERGMWDTVTVLPPAERPPGEFSYWFSDFGTRVMRFCGIAALLLGLMFSCMAGIADKIGRNDPPPAWLTISMLFVGGLLIFMSFAREKRLDQRGSHQRLTVRQLATEKKFQVHALTLQQAKEYELQVRETLKALADSLRSSRAIPEVNTYEL